jgi:hypothetical protein
MEQLWDSDKLSVNNGERNHAAPIQIIAVKLWMLPFHLS